MIETNWATKIRQAANIMQVGPFLVPGNDYDTMRHIKRSNSPAWLKNIVLRWSPAVVRALAVHIEAMEYVSRRCGANIEAPQDINDYLTAFGGRPFVGVFKYIEGIHFRSIPDAWFDGRTIEIGISDSRVSNLHFRGRKISVGVEYLADRLKARSSLVHELVLSCDLRSLPFSNAAFDTVFCVHIFDDLSFPIGHALKEIARVLTLGGRVAFSTASDLYGSTEVTNYHKNYLKLSKQQLNDYRKLRYAGIQNPGRSQLENACFDAGFEIEIYQEFLSSRIGGAWDAGMTVEMGLGHWAADRLPPLGARIVEKARDSFIRAALVAEKTADRGLNVFCVARRTR